MTQNKKIIAVTGGIGSGKSTVCEILKEYGYPVLSCDKIYGELLENKDLIKRIEAKFGSVTDVNGNLDRIKLSEIVFNDMDAREELNKITHPEIMKELLQRAKNYKNNIVFCEVPLLFENGYEVLFDDVFVVIREDRKRIESVKLRSKLSEAQVRSRIAAQYDYSKVDRSKYKIIENNGNIYSLKSTMRDIIINF